MLVGFKFCLAFYLDLLRILDSRLPKKLLDIVQESEFSVISENAIGVDYLEFLLISMQLRRDLKTNLPLSRYFYMDLLCQSFFQNPKSSAIKA